MNINVKVKQLHDNALLPVYATPGSACFDLFWCPGNGPVDVGARSDHLTLGTGLAFEIPEGHVMLLFSRSGHGAKGVRLANCVGVIDSDYRGEVKVMLRDDTVGPYSVFQVAPYDRIAQAMVIPAPQCILTVVESLSDTSRGSGGFGSTGK